MSKISDVIDDYELGLLYDDDNDSVSDVIIDEDDDVKNIKQVFNIPKHITLKFDSYTRVIEDANPKELKLALVKKHHSLWAEFVYNASRVLADMIDTKRIDTKGKCCLELGAGAGLPGLVAALNDAEAVIITDYGSETEYDLIYAIDINIAFIKQYMASNTNIYGLDYIFGNKCDSFFAKTNGKLFDIVIMADLIFNRSEHRKLLTTLKMTLAKSGECWCSFSHHDPHKSDKDLNFFTIAKEEFGFNVDIIEEVQRQSYPFIENDGRDAERGVVYVVKLYF